MGRFIKLLLIIILDMGKVVLTADRTLMTEYNGLAPLGHFSCLPDRMVPSFINRFIIFPPFFPLLNCLRLAITKGIL